MTKIITLFDWLKTSYKNNPWRGRLVIFFLALIFILGLARLLLPQTIIYSTTSWLKKQGIDASIEAININIFDGTVSLVNATGQSDGKTLFDIGLVDIYWRWAPLSDKTIVVTKVGLDKLNINIEQYNDEIIIGGVTIPLGDKAGSTPEASDEEIEDPIEHAKPWAASLGEVIFTNLKVCYLQHNANHKQINKDSLFVDYCVALNQMTWAGTISYATDVSLIESGDIPVSSTGDFTLDGFSIIDNRLNRDLLVSSSNNLKNVVISGLNKLKIDQLQMDDLSLLQRDDKKHRDAIRFHQLTMNDIHLSNLDSLEINNINIKKPGVYASKQSQTEWEYQQWIPQSSNTDTNDSGTSDVKQASTANDSAFKVAINNIVIDDSDLCYQEEAVNLYYCLTFSKLDWKGRINYDTAATKSKDLNLQVKGDLDLLTPHIHNQKLDRDLAELQSLSLKQLDLNGTNNINLNNLSIKQFAALQRSENQQDNTVTFDDLEINSIRYTKDKVEIDTITLDGLGSTVSKNKNGTWEHDKWQPI